MVHPYAHSLRTLVFAFSTIPFPHTVAILDSAQSSRAYDDGPRGPDLASVTRHDWSMWTAGRPLVRNELEQERERGKGLRYLVLLLALGGQCEVVKKRSGD